MNGRSQVFGADCGLSVCEAGIRLGNQSFSPDDTKAYLEFRLSHALPVITFYGEALHPRTVANSFHSLLHQPLNLGHLLKAYDRETITRDRIIGSVVAVEFPPPSGGISATTEEAPGVRAVASVFKLAEGVDRIIGQHQSGKKRHTVSMEVSYRNSESGFLVRGPVAGARTPPDLAAAGWSYVPHAEAPEELKATRDFDRSRMRDAHGDGRRVGRYQGMETYWLMGGPDGQVQYMGVGVVEHGAEPTAEIARLLAARETPPAPDTRTVMEIFENLEKILKI